MKHRIVRLLFLFSIIVLALLSLFVSVSIWYFVAAYTIFLAIVAYGSSQITSQYHLKAICRGSGNLRQVALTFDDGPHPETARILDILKKHQLKATFFCIGKNIEQHPQIMRRIIAEGHSVGNHSFSHTRAFDLYRKDRVVEELRQTDALLEKYSGLRNPYFRPPYGVTNPSIRRAVEITGHKVIGWNIRSLDTVIKNKPALLKRIEKRLFPGGIVLLHDTVQQTADALEDILKLLSDNNYRVVPLEELLHDKL